MTIEVHEEDAVETVVSLGAEPSLFRCVCSLGCFAVRLLVFVGAG